MREYESIHGDNLEEADQAQLLSVTQSADAVARIRAAIPTGPSLPYCETCDEEIPLARQTAIAGCRLCIECQTIKERRV